MPAREEILGRMKSAGTGRTPKRPVMPALSELALDREQMIQRFTAELSAQTGMVHRAAGKDEILRILTDTAAAEGLKMVVTSGDETLSSLDLDSWGLAGGIKVLTAKNLADRESFRNAAFSADAGITSADFAIAETGTIGIAFKANQPRLASIAPPVHIAIIPVERLYPVYECATEEVFKDTGEAPSQFSFITGPSSTGDIQAVQFKGMHGPTKVVVILVMGQG
ncbi:MAG TPA: lactate utilization protein [Desulfomonilia bacterium]|nr:lactate utilization protein [Desulfomonilia bacterium]